jgi:hypothetical protein
MAEVASARLEKILALLLVQSMKGSSPGEKTFALSVAGFGNNEIADLLGTTPGAVNQSLYERRKGKKKKKATSKKR